MSNLPTKKFPYSDYDVVIVEKDDVLATIEENIIDKDVANELITALETRAYNYLCEQQGVQIPYLGSIKIPDGLRKENRDRDRDAIKYAYEHFDRKKYVAFIKDLGRVNKERFQCQKMINSAFEIMIKKRGEEYDKARKEKGDAWAKLYIASLYFLKTSKKYYEREYEESLNNESYGET